MFVPLTHNVLEALKARGFHVLTSVSKWGDESPTFWPQKVEGDIGDYVLSKDLRGELTGEEHFLVIEEALKIPEEILLGVVWLDKEIAELRGGA